MVRPHDAWVVLADANRARLLHCQPAPLDRPHVEEVELIEYDWAGHQRGRPSLLAGRTGHSHADDSHDEQEQRHRFALAVGQWLRRQVGDRRLDHVTVFAPPRLTNMLHEALPTELAGRVEQREAELTNVPTHTLSDHPAIRELMGME